MKGISPLIATILLIAFTVAVAGLISTWLLGFTSQTTSTVSSQANIEVVCNSGAISLGDLSYCSSTGRLAGKISNTGTISLGNFSLIVLYNNASSEIFYLNNAGGTISASTSCCANMTMLAGQIYIFNFTIGGSNYDRIRATTNCTAKVTADAKSSDISTSC